MIIDKNKIIQEVKENHMRLKSCPKHKFIITEKGLMQRLSCIHCGGIMNTVDVLHYRDGYVAAGGTETDVLERYV